MIVLIGKTCVGKDFIRKEFIKMGMKTVVAYTTRTPRENETDGVEYHFISKEEFLQKEDEGFFVETISYNVASGETWYYGSAVEDLSDDKVIIVNPHSLRQLRKIRSLNPIIFYIMAGEETIWNRLRERGDDAAEARRRLNEDDKDFSGIIDDVDFAFSNDMGLNPKTLAEMILDTYKKVIGEIHNE